MPESAKFLTISQPNPPAPTTRISYYVTISKKSSDVTRFYVKADWLLRIGLIFSKVFW